jgi:hypothetical protein
MAKPSISVRIVLSEDISTATPTPEPVVRHCGDEILGYLEVITCGIFEFDVLVSFEGCIYSLIIIMIYVTKVEFRLRPNLDCLWFRK